MDLILFVSEDVLKDLVTKWLDLVDVAKLDSAYLLHNSRARLLGLLANSHSKFVHGVERNFSNANENLAYLRWVAKRECRIRSICVPIELADEEDLLSEFFHSCGPNLNKIELRLYKYHLSDQAYDYIIARVTEYCHHLQELTLTDAFPENPDLLHQLSLR